jgi:hypothetical protein
MEFVPHRVAQMKRNNKVSCLTGRTDTKILLLNKLDTENARHIKNGSLYIKRGMLRATFSHPTLPASCLFQPLAFRFAYLRIEVFMAPTQGRAQRRFRIPA